MHTRTVIFILGALLGILIGEVSMVASEVAISVLMLGVVQTTLYFFDRRNRKQARVTIGDSRLFSISLLTLLFSYGVFTGIIRIQFTEEKINFTCLSSCTFGARIISSPETKDEYQLFGIHPVDDDTNELYDIQVRTSLYPRYSIGETLKISGIVMMPSVVLPHSGTKNSTHAFDYASYLRTRNIGSEMMYPKIEVADVEAHSLIDILGRWKENVVERMTMYVSSPSSQIANGMLLGVASLSQELKETFRVAGLSHIIVLSGFNIAIVISFVLFVFAFLPLAVRVVLASLCVIGFVVMVGGEASVVRATIMSFIGLLAMLAGRAYVARQALILSLFAIVMYDPYSLMHDVSLHLSFLATAGIVYMSESWMALFSRYAPGVTSQSLRELFIMTLSAYVATLPYIIYTFGTVSVYSLLANILVIPFIPLAMLLSFAVVVSSYLFHPLASAFGFIDTMLIDMIIAIARTLEKLPFSSFLFSVSFGSMCMMYVLILICMKHSVLRKRNETHTTNENGNLTDVIPY